MEKINNRNENGLKDSCKMYRTINGVEYNQWSSDLSVLENSKKEYPCYKFIVRNNEIFKSCNKILELPREGNTDDQFFQKIKQGVDDTITTKEVGERLGISTQKAYKKMTELENRGLVSKYGYRTQDGWEDIFYSGRQSQSLGWQRNKTVK